MRVVEVSRTGCSTRLPLASAKSHSNAKANVSSRQHLGTTCFHSPKSRRVQSVKALCLQHGSLRRQSIPPSEPTFSHHQVFISKVFKLATVGTCLTSKQVCRAKEPDKESTRTKGQDEQARKTLRLILLRHAKSSWDDPSLEDHERPLNKRGRKAAPDVAAQLRALGWEPELILSSDSIRTQETLHQMSKEWGKLSKVPAEFLRSLYEVAATEDGPTNTAHHLEEVVRERAGSSRCVMLVGHNMGWEQAVSQYVGEYVQMKTAYAALLESNATSWEEAFRNKWELKAIVKPESSKSSKS